MTSSNESNWFEGVFRFCRDTFRVNLMNSANCAAKCAVKLGGVFFGESVFELSLSDILFAYSKDRRS